MSKKHDNLIEKIADWENVMDAYRKTQRGRLKYQRGSLRFSQDLTVNLNALAASIANGEYQPGPYYQFMVYEPRERLIFAPAFPDKVVQHMINNILKDIYLPCYISDSFACLEGRGTHRAVERISDFARRAKRRWGSSAYIVKADVKKFFYSIDREILKGLLRKKISDRNLLLLLGRIIDSSPGDRGLPLGNLTSQLFANIYLNELDQFVKRKLGIRYYVRYADDAVAFVSDKPAAEALKTAMSRFVSKQLNLELHPEKSKIFPLSQGVNVVGFKIHPTHRLLRNDCKRKIKRKLRAMPGLILSGRLRREKAGHMVGSWFGHAKHGNSHNFISSLVDRHPIVRMRGRRLTVQPKKERRYDLP